MTFFVPRKRGTHRRYVSRGFVDLSGNALNVIVEFDVSVASSTAIHDRALRQLVSRGNVGLLESARDAFMSPRASPNSPSGLAQMPCADYPAATWG